MAIQRRKVPNLSPLKAKVEAWLTEWGVQFGQGTARRGTAWWVAYFELPLEEWTNPYASLENPVPWNTFVTDISEGLAAARHDKQLWANLVSEGKTPVD